MNPALTLFWVAAGGLILIGLLPVLAPLVTEHRLEAERVRARARGLAGACAVCVPAAACFIYLQIGAPHALLEPQAQGHRLNQPDMEAATAALARRLQTEADDLEGWFMLARSYQAMERWDDAAQAYRAALRLAPGEPKLLADLADVVATGRGGSLDGEPMSLIEQALQREPEHPKSLALKAIHEFREGRYHSAIEHWERLSAVQEPGSEAAALAESGIAKARALLASAEPDAAGSPGTGQTRR
jgi:cytochrome c-type biogenesis protein CcmH